MKHLFHDMLGEATRLTQGGQLQAATDMIQRALREAGAASMPGSVRPDANAADDGLVIDVETRVVGEPKAQADDGAEQWIGPEQQRPGDHAQQFAVPAVHAACGARGRIGPIRRF